MIYFKMKMSNFFTGMGRASFAIASVKHLSGVFVSCFEVFLDRVGFVKGNCCHLSIFLFSFSSWLKTYFLLKMWLDHDNSLFYRMVFLGDAGESESIEALKVNHPPPL